MKMKKQLISLIALSMIAITIMYSCKKDDEISPGSASIISFSADGVNGTITESAKIVLLELPPGQDLTAVTPAIVVSAGAKISPASGTTQNFSSPVTYTVTDRSGKVTSMYTVTVTSEAIKSIAFIGMASANTSVAWDALDGSDFDLDDDQTAAHWFDSAYASPARTVSYFSFEDVANGQDLSSFDAIWIQYDGGWWGGEVAQFPNNNNNCLLHETGIDFGTPCADLASNFVTAIKNYYESGGNIFLGNFAGSIVDDIGVVSSSDYAPNNAFGGITVDDGATSSAWGARWSSDVTSPLFKNIITATDAGCAAPYFVLLDAGTLKKNRSNQYNLNFGPWAPNGDSDPLADRRASFIMMTGVTVLVENCGGNEMQMLEWPANGSKGKVIAMLAGTYDWYVGGVPNNGNTKILTKNVLDYLVN
jgi:hypothetical protein